MLPAQEWAAQQEAIRNAPLEITYSYWDGQGHRRKVTVRQGDSIGVFLKAVREQLAPAFRELRAISVDNLMYVKVGGGRDVCIGGTANGLDALITWLLGNWQ